jgi:hypothetical protein
MLESRLKKLVAIVVFSNLSISMCSAQKMNVKIIQRQSSETLYSYVVPAFYSSTTNTNVNCRSGLSRENCDSNTSSNGYSRPSKEVSYSVTGATFSLLLPDDRVAIVNCANKPNFDRGRDNSFRSCRIPLVNDVQVQFKGKNAKLFWLASVDGTKFDSETYRILAVLDK